MHFQFLYDVVCHSEQESEGKVELVILVEVEVDLLVEVRVGEVEFEGLVEAQAQFEDCFVVPRKDDLIVALSCLNADAWPFTDVLFILKPKVTELNIFRWVILDLKVTFSFEQSKLLFIILIGEVNRNDLVSVLKTLPQQLLVSGLCQRWEVMLNEDLVIDDMVSFESDVSHWHFRLNER